MAKRKSIKGVHELEIEFTRLTEQVKAWKVIAISCSSVILVCATAFFGLTQYNLHVKVNAAIEQAASKKAEQLANEYAVQAKASAQKAKESEKDANKTAGKIKSLYNNYEPELDKFKKLNKNIDSDDNKIIVSKLQLGKKWLLSGVGDHFGNDNYLRLMDATDRKLYGFFAAYRLWSMDGNVHGSDITNKKDIEILENSLEKIMLLRGVRFRWIDSVNEQDFRIGLIAQEVEKVFPEVVSIGPGGKKGINYSALIAPLINSIQEQFRIIEKQNDKISSLEKRLSQQ